jgi:hypothetical protein
LTLEKQKSVDQKLAATYSKVAVLLRARPEIFSRQGAVVAGLREYQGCMLGPYHRLVYRDGGRQRSLYLGRSAELADAVGALLRHLQAPRQRRRTWARMRAQARAALRAQKGRWQEDLARWGLRAQGYEVRGWRSRPARDEAIYLREYLERDGKEASHGWGE